jgi:hypothetical protein
MYALFNLQQAVGKDKMVVGSIGGIIYLSPGKRTDGQATTTRCVDKRHLRRWIGLSTFDR